MYIIVMEKNMENRGYRWALNKIFFR